MIARWLGLPDRRSVWIFSLAILCIATCLLTTALGPPARRMDLLMLACLISALGAQLLNRSWGSWPKTLPEIYRERLRSGVRMSFAAKLLSLLCMGFFVIAFVVKT